MLADIELIKMARERFGAGITKVWPNGPRVYLVGETMKPGWVFQFREVS